jgi:hypothetical protein
LGKKSESPARSNKAGRIGGWVWVWVWVGEDEEYVDMDVDVDADSVCVEVFSTLSKTINRRCRLNPAIEELGNHRHESKS